MDDWALIRRLAEGVAKAQIVPWRSVWDNESGNGLCV